MPHLGLDYKRGLAEFTGGLIGWPVASGLTRPLWPSASGRLQFRALLCAGARRPPRMSSLWRAGSFRATAGQRDDVNRPAGRNSCSERVSCDGSAINRSRLKIDAGYWTTVLLEEYSLSVVVSRTEILSEKV